MQPWEQQRQGGHRDGAELAGVRRVHRAPGCRAEVPAWGQEGPTLRSHTLLPAALRGRNPAPALPHKLPTRRQEAPAWAEPAGRTDLHPSGPRPPMWRPADPRPSPRSRCSRPPCRSPATAQRSHSPCPPPAHRHACALPGSPTTAHAEHAPEPPQIPSGALELGQESPAAQPLSRV